MKGKLDLMKAADVVLLERQVSISTKGAQHQASFKVEPVYIV